MIKQKTFVILLVILFFNMTILGNVFSDFYNFMFCNGIVLKQDAEPKQWEAFKNEKKYRSMWAALSAKTLKFDTKYLKSTKSVQEVGKKVRLITAPTKIYQICKISEYRLPFYKKSQNINAEFILDKEHLQNEKYSIIFKDYTTSHHLMIGDALILGAVAAVGYFAYTEFKQ